MAKILIRNTTKFLLDSVVVEEKFSRGYLGLSGVGDECMRKTWMSWRFVSPRRFPKRVKRIFERGDLEEARVIRDLKEIGTECFRRDENGEKVEIFGHVGEKQEELHGIAGHSKGHPDGRCIGVVEAPKTEHTLEIKTMGDKYWKQFQDNGISISHPVYHCQVQRYMDLMGTTRTLLISRNKNTEETAVERIKLDKIKVQEVVAKETHILMSELPPKAAYSKTHWKCKTCNHAPVCHEGQAPLKNCRTCKHLDVEDGGVFSCALSNGKHLSLERQIKGCDHYGRLF